MMPVRSGDVTCYFQVPFLEASWNFEFRGKVGSETRPRFLAAGTDWNSNFDNFDFNSKLLHSIRQPGLVSMINRDHCAPCVNVGCLLGNNSTV